MIHLSSQKSGWAVPLPNQKTIVIGITLALIVGAWMLFSVLHPGIDSTDRNVVSTAVLKDKDPSLFTRDTLFSFPEIYGYYTPLYLWIVSQAWDLGGSFELGFIWLLPLVMGGYLVAMFILLHQVIGNSWIALGLTVAAAHYHNVMGASGWGVGNSGSLGARTLFMPAAPLITLLLLKMIDRPGWRMGAPLGLLLGLATNLHPISGFHFLALSVAFFILIHGFSRASWQTLIAASGAILAGGLPIIWHFLQRAGKPVDPQVTFEAFSKIVTELYSLPFSPNSFTWPLFHLEISRPTLDILVWFYLGLVLVTLFIYGLNRYKGSPVTRPDWVRWGWLAGGLITLAYAFMLVLFESTFIFLWLGLYIVYRFWRGGPSRLESRLMVFTGLIVFYSFGGYYLFTLTWQTFQLWALTSFLTEYARSAAFVYLPLYMLAGLAGVTWAKDLAQAFPKQGRQKFLGGSENDFALPVAVGLALGPAALAGFSESLPLSLVTLSALLLGMGAAFALKKSLSTSLNSGLGLVLLALVLFGPPADLLASYLPVPAINMFQADNRIVQPVYDPVDAELYNWVAQKTTPTSLFYGCFGPVTMTHFRFRAQRSISHNWKDLTFNLHHRASLVPAYNRFRELEAACENFDSMVAMSHTLQADYILVSTEKAAGFLPEACFVNKKYAVFARNPEGCP